MRQLLPCILSLTLAACGASIVPPGAHDASIADDTPDVPHETDVPRETDVPHETNVPHETVVPHETDVPAAQCDVSGRWSGWWSFTERGQGEMRSAIALRFSGRGVTGLGIRPSGEIVDGALSRDGALRFTVRNGPYDVGFSFNGSLSSDCDVVSGRYATHFYGGNFALHREVCTAPMRALSLDGPAVDDNLTNAPIAMIADCGRPDPVQHHVFSLVVPRRATVAVTVASTVPGGQDLGVSLRADCDAPETSCAPANEALRRTVDPGTYRVVVSARINRGIPYSVRAVTVPDGP